MLPRCGTKPFMVNWWNIAERPEQPAAVEPVDSIQCRQIDCIDVPHGHESSNHFSLEQAVDALGQRVVVRVSRTDARRNPMRR